MKNRIFFLLFLLCQFQIFATPEFVSLGRDCQIAGILKNFKLREEALPLDWVGTGTFSTVIKAIDEDFVDFLNPEYLKYGKYCVTNVKYNFGYNHFFPFAGKFITANWLDYLPKVLITQNRRIERLNQLLASNKKVVFIRTVSITPEEAQEFVLLIKRKYPKLNFTLAVVLEDTVNKETWDVENVMTFYCSEKRGRADWWSDAEWARVLDILLTLK